MDSSRPQIGIAIGAGALLLAVFFGYLLWLNGQGPVLARSDARDPLSGIPNNISLNPLRDRTSERVQAEAYAQFRAGHEEGSLRLTLSARNMAQRAMRLAGKA